MASHFKICPEKKMKEKVSKKKETKEGTAKPAVAGNDTKNGEAPGDDSSTLKATGGETVQGAEGITSAKGVTKSAKKSASKEAKTGTTDSKTKKRKADAEGDKEPKKKKLKKDEPAKPKVSKPKGPVDVEKQCGVLLPNGGYCARSLTCKSHSMGAKRAVPGRSMPYDFLLAQYQKKNQAKQQKAAMDANAPLVDDTDTHAPVDSDEEKDAVMAGLARWRPQPMAQHVHVSLRRKHQRIRVKEALAQALAGNRGGNLFATQPPEAQTASGPSQMAIAAATMGNNGAGAEGGNVVASPMGTGAGVGSQSGESGGGGNGGLERRPSLIQQALGVSGNAAAGGGGTGPGGAGSESKKSSVTMTSTIT
ncbi:MAG: hypothetical protein LQ346_000531 [Caloplaca aetnensis]|nr:MAG: hypothetical protein LQ346_000531 [Caloplaca aetnensis]